MSAGGPTGNRVFAPIIFFIAFREALEASLVIGILLGMLESLVAGQAKQVDTHHSSTASETTQSSERDRRLLIRRLRKMVILGALAGLFVAACIGAAFLAVFYTQATDLWGKSEELWEGIFNLIAVVLITPMSLAILRADQSRAKWTKKLRLALRHDSGSEKGTRGRGEKEGGGDTPAAAADEERPSSSASASVENGDRVGVPAVLHGNQKKKDAAASSSSTSRWATTLLHKLNPLPARGQRSAAITLFLIPFVTTLREGLEGVVFIGGVSLGLPASSIPLPAIVGLAAGFACGYVVFKAGSFSKIKLFLVLSTGILLLIAAGMISRAAYSLGFYRYVQLVGDGAAESGDGPGSYYWKTYVWHFNCCNPEDKTGSAGGWAVFNSLLGWNNTATVASVTIYSLYWACIALYLLYATWSEGRLRLVVPTFSRSSKPGKGQSRGRGEGGRKVVWESGRARARRVRGEERARAAAEARAARAGAKGGAHPAAPVPLLVDV